MTKEDVVMSEIESGVKVPVSQFSVRHSVAADAEQLTHLYAQTQLYSDTLQLPFPTIARWQERLGDTSPSTFSFVACDGERIAGQITLRIEPNLRRRHVASFGMGVDASYHGQGVGSLLLKTITDLCDNWINVRRIELTVFVDNHAALALYQKFGFEIEGTSKCFAVRDGKFVDAHHMGRVVAGAV
jgi:putative acetyltransferase